MTKLLHWWKNSFDSIDKFLIKKILLKNSIILGQAKIFLILNKFYLIQKIFCLIQNNSKFLRRSLSTFGMNLKNNISMKGSINNNLMENATEQFYTNYCVQTILTSKKLAVAKKFIKSYKRANLRDDFSDDTTFNYRNPFYNQNMHIKNFHLFSLGQLFNQWLKSNYHWEYIYIFYVFTHSDNLILFINWKIYRQLYRQIFNT